MVLKRLPLKGVLNLRDLGGYPAGPNKVTKWRTLFRADGLFCLDESDIDFIIGYCNPGLVIDLRGTEELSIRPNVFENNDTVRFLSVPLIAEDRDLELIRTEWQNLDTAYAAIIEYSKEQIKSIIEAVANNLPSPVIYNCTAGKDRTGIVTALILGACDIDDYDITADYEISSTYIRRDLDKLTEPNEELNMEHVLSPREIIKDLLTRLKENYGSVSGYLSACGIGEETIDRIKEHFLVTYN